MAFCNLAIMRIKNPLRGRKITLGSLFYRYFGGCRPFLVSNSEGITNKGNDQLISENVGLKRINFDKGSDTVIGQCRRTDHKINVRNIA
jgi:hypothetical protein